MTPAGVWAQSLPGVSSEDSELAYAAAVRLLDRSMRPNAEGQYPHQLLTAIRQMRDPSTAPLFGHLVQSDVIIERLQGMLGEATLRESQEVELSVLAEIPNVSIQAQFIKTAMDNNLVSEAQMRQIYTWADADFQVKLLIATELIGDEKTIDLEPIREGLAHNSPVIRGLSAALLTQAGDSSGPAMLDTLALGKDQAHLVTKARLLELAAEHDLDQMRDWSWKVAQTEGQPAALSELASRVAVRFAHPDAVKTLQDRYAEAERLGEKRRIAFLMMELSPWLPAKLYLPLQQEEDNLVRKIGLAGAAIADQQPSLVEPLVDMVNEGHRIPMQWSLRYARGNASPEDAQLVLLGLIQAANQVLDDDTTKLRAQRLQLAVVATQTLAEDHPDLGPTLIRDILFDSTTTDALKKAILGGLLQANIDNADEIVIGIDPGSEDISQSAYLLLLAKNNQPLTAAQNAALAEMVKGGGIIDDALRLQAAWSYLRYSNQIDRALAEVLK